jgi:hypothetical protein
LVLNFGAGKIDVSAGAKDLVNGTATYNIPDLKPVITAEGDLVHIAQGNFKFKTLGALKEVHNEWDLKLGAAPIDLTIEAGAYEAKYDFGGLSLSALTIKDGAADVKLDFSAPNLTEMSVFRYETGASNVRLSNLANANFNTLIFKSGAGDYTLDFGGELKQNASVSIETGLSNMILIIPEGMNAEVTVDSGVSNVNAGPGWEQSGSRYIQTASGPKVTIVVKMGAGNLTLTR